MRHPLADAYTLGYAAGLRGDDPRLCPFAPMTALRRAWNEGHHWGAFMHRTEKKRPAGSEGMPGASSGGTPNPEATGPVNDQDST